MLMSVLAEGIAKALGARCYVVSEGAYSVTCTKGPNGLYVNGYK